VDLSSLGWIAGGLVGLVAGGHLLVLGASRLAAALRVPPVVIGLTVVAFGTSAPELAVSVQSAAAGQADVAVGNVVGSNIFNVLFILGISAVITPLAVAQVFVRKETPLLIVVSLVTWALCADGRFGPLEGAVFVVGLALYTLLAIRQGRREGAKVGAEYAREYGPGRNRVGWQVLVALAGLGALVLGSRWFVAGSVEIARALGVSELVIGLTVVATGTSLPEVATSIVAAWKGERDIAVGNVVGSNIFNLLGVLGATAVVGGGVPVPDAALRFDMPVMVAAAVACLPVFFTGHRVDRWEGLVFLGCYAAYVTWLVLAATGHAARDAFAVGVLGFALPLGALTLGVGVWRALRGRRRPPSRS
jgi:cation:H+ antiporter